MEIWSEIRREVLTGALSKRAAIAKYKVGWHTLKKILAHDEPPGYRQAKQRPKPKFDVFLPLIRQMLEDDGKAPPKQKHTARRIFERLRHAAAAVRARDWLPLGGRAVGTRLLGSNGSSTAATFWRPRARATGSRTPAGDNDGPLARPDTQILGATGYPGVDSTHPQRCPF